jgi:hypothetical protein
MDSTQFRRALAVLRMPRRIPEMGAYTQAILDLVTKNAFFPSPTPPLATLEADLTAFLAAEAAALNRGKGTVAARDVSLLTLRTDLEHLLAYVQLTADANPSEAGAIIESAGLGVRKVGTPTKAALQVKQGPDSGTVKLYAKAVSARASYDWQYSTGEKAWTDMPSTLQAKTVLSGLTPVTLYSFRVRGLTKGGEGGWSQVVTFTVA